MDLDKNESFVQNGANFWIDTTMKSHISAWNVVPADQSRKRKANVLKENDL